MHAAVFVCSLLTFRFLRKKPNMLFPFLMVWLMCLFQDILDCIKFPLRDIVLSPQLLRYGLWEYRPLNVDSWILRFSVCYIFSGWKAMPHFFSHSASWFRSSCMILASLSFFILLYRMQSSANSLVLDWTQSGRSFMKRRNNNGPKTVPWGTLLITVTLSEVAPSTCTCWALSVRKAWIHLYVLPLTPKWSICFNRRLCGTRSNALEKSRMIRSYWCFLSKPDTSSWARVSSCVSQLRLALNPCWQSVSTWCSSRCFKTLLVIMCSWTLQQRLVRETGL